jgi:hypothetical protein
MMPADSILTNKKELKMKYFNTTGFCHPDKHYMVDINKQLSEMEKLVEREAYFVINRARQYGKTTTLKLLRQRLLTRYIVFFISFEGMSMQVFADENSFCKRFYGLLNNSLYSKIDEFPEQLKNKFEKLERSNEADNNLFMLSRVITEMCSQVDKPVILLIDEVDQAGNYDIFLNFLSMLRNKYLDRFEVPTFQSVILAGVYDIVNLKKKIRNGDDHIQNSPWNIAAKFNIDMSLTVVGIQKMLSEYEQDIKVGMDVETMANLIFDYTSGYPFLVSSICKIVDEELLHTGHYQSKEFTWTKAGFLEAIRILLEEKNSLFDSLMGKVINYPELAEILSALLFNGSVIEYSNYHPTMNLAAMFGFVKNNNKQLVISNRIFEILLYNHFLSAKNMRSHEIYKVSQYDKSQFIENGILNMKKILEKFVIHFTDIFSDSDSKFLEETGRRFFLLYLKPIINGRGNYYIESRTRDMGRTDIIVDYQKEQYIIELKLWRGDEYNNRGEQQLIRYLDSYNLSVGYLVSFNFNQKKQVGVREIIIGDKKIIEAVV